MDFGSIAAPLISGGASIAGGLISNYQDRAMWEKNADLSREFAQQGIQWRVADAIKAGVHPLYALGAPTFSPAVTSPSDSLGPGVAQAGQDISRAISSRLTPEERMMVQLDLQGKRIANEKDAAIASYYASEAARNVQGAGASVGLPSSVVGHRGDAPYGIPGINYPIRYDKDMVEFQAAPQVSSRSEDTGLSAATNPGFEVFTLPGGGKLVVPSTGGQGLSETGENLGFPMDKYLLFLTIMESIKHRLTEGDLVNPFTQKESGRERYKKKMQERR